MSLIQYFNADLSQKEWLQNKINNPGIHDMPSMDEVIDYLESTPDDESSEQVMGDLIIQYIDGEGLMFDLC